MSRLITTARMMAVAVVSCFLMGTHGADVDNLSKYTVLLKVYGHYLHIDLLISTQVWEMIRLE